jgi:hypothetical protein
MRFFYGCYCGFDRRGRSSRKLGCNIPATSVQFRVTAPFSALDKQTPNTSKSWTELIGMQRTAAKRP